MDARDRKTTGLPVVFSMANTECIWSKAGVIDSAECVNAFDCLGCPLEKSAQAALEERSTVRGEAAPARNMMTIMPRGKCRHMLSGLISYAMCSHESCASCPVEQMIEDSCVAPGRSKSAVANASGYDVARNYYYHRSHAWARVEYGGWVRVGIDDFALRLVGQQDAIEAPEPGSKVSQGHPAVILKRSGREAAIISPVDGIVVAINHKVLDRAFIANDAPYEDGWLMLIQPTNLRENLKNLFFDAEGDSWIDEEAMTLNALLAEESSLSLVAPETETARDVFHVAPEIGWDRLVGEFLS